ncbi:kinase-like domain-containing protein [Amylostereum chailletii]|nr:kinase-like domain-containing protein [Amylostereum chailletii]
MIQLESISPSRDSSSVPTLADLSRNASVISTSSNSSSSTASLLLTPPRRPRPIRTFSSPRSQSPGGPTTPRASRPPAYITRELGLAEEPQEPSRAAELTLPRSRAPSKSKSRSSSANGRTSVEDYEFGEVLGEGSYSTVMHVTHRTTRQEFAAKILDKGHLKRHDKLQTALAEKNTLIRLGSGHPGIVRLHSAFQDEWSLYFVLDLARNGELQSRISRMGSLSTACARYYTAQVVDALDYMHSRGVIHRDLKPENLLLDDAFRIKVTDFGTGKLINVAAEPATKTFVGTAQYVSPELLEANETSKSSDLWALGCVLYQMIAGRFAFQGLSEYLTWQKIKHLEYSFPEGFDEQAKDLVRRLLVRDPLERLGAGPQGSDHDMSALRAHPFFAGVNWQTLWTNPAPPLESGLVRREHPLGVGSDQNWEDVGAAWDELVGGDEGGDDDDDDDDSSVTPGDDGVRWAQGAEGRGCSLTRVAQTPEVVPPEEVGPRGELPSYARDLLPPARPPPSPTPGASSDRTMVGSTAAVLAPPLPVVVNGNRAIQFQLPDVVALSAAVESTSGTDDTSSVGTGADNSPERPADGNTGPATQNGSVNGHDPPGANGVQSAPVSVPAVVRDAYATSSSDGSPVEKLGAALEAMKLNRGRNRTRSPMRNAGPPVEPDWSSVLSPGEVMLFNSEVEETVMKRRTSRLLLPLPVAPRRPKVRQLVLTSHRLVCLKQLKSGRGIGIKSEYSLRPSEKEKEKDREKEQRCMVTGVAKKGAREFVMFTTSKSGFFVAETEDAASVWVEKITEALRVHGEQHRERKPSNNGTNSAART